MVFFLRRLCSSFLIKFIQSNELLERYRFAIPRAHSFGVTSASRAMAVLRHCSREVLMSLTKEYFDYQAYLPEEECNELGLLGLGELFKSQWLASNEAGEDNVGFEFATPLKPLSNEIFVRL